MLAHDVDDRRELGHVRRLHELARAVHRARLRTPLAVLEVREGELLEPQARPEGPDEEDVVHELHPPVVPQDVRALQAAVLDHEGDAVHDRELLLHRHELHARRGEARRRIGHQSLERRDLLEEHADVDVLLLADRAGVQPVHGLERGELLELGVGDVVAHEALRLLADLHDRLLGVGAVEHRREVLRALRDDAERSGEAGVHARRGLLVGRDAASDRGLDAVVVAHPDRPVAELRDAGGVGGGESAESLERTTHGELRLSVLWNWMDFQAAGCVLVKRLKPNRWLAHIFWTLDTGPIPPKQRIRYSSKVACASHAITPEVEAEAN